MGVQRIVMAISALLVSSQLVLGQEPKHSQGLLLMERRIELEIVENLAVVRIIYTVKNTSNETMEGKITFRAPAGSAVCDATLLRHIASPERRAKVMPPKFARRLYDAVKRSEVDRQTWEKIDRGTSATFFDASLLEELRNTQDPLRNGLDPKPEALKPNSLDAAKHEESGAFSSPPPQETNSEEGPPPREEECEDPALLSYLGPDTYELLFFPVPAHSDQTVSVVFATAVPLEENRSTLRIPLWTDSNLLIHAGHRDAFHITLRSSKAIKAIESPTHWMDPLERTSNFFEAAARRTRQPKEELVLHYLLSPEARRFDFTQKVAWSELAPIRPGSRWTFAEAERAILAKRALEQGSEPIDRVCSASKVVSSVTSLLVIERSRVREILRESPPEPIAIHPSAPKPESQPSTDWERCEWVRRFLKLAPLKQGDGCEQRTFHTTDPQKILWARQNGFVTSSPRPYGFMTYTYVTHLPGCSLQERNVALLKDLATHLMKERR